MDRGLDEPYRGFGLNVDDEDEEDDTGGGGGGEGTEPLFAPVPTLVSPRGR